MWEYLTRNKGQHEYQHHGRRLYIRAGVERGSTDDEKKQKAVRKVVRALIERHGGDGKTVKPRIDAKYAMGAVWWKSDDGKWEKVAEWIPHDQKISMLGTAETLQKTVDEFLA